MQIKKTTLTFHLIPVIMTKINDINNITAHVDADAERWENLLLVIVSVNWYSPRRSQFGSSCARRSSYTILGD